MAGSWSDEPTLGGLADLLPAPLPHKVLLSISGWLADGGRGPSHDLLTRSLCLSPLLQGVRPVSARQPHPLGLGGGLAGVRHHGHQQPLGGQPTAQPGPAALGGDSGW